MNRIHGPSYPSWEYNDPARKSYSRWVSGCILVIFGVIGFVAGMCWIINQVGGAK